MFKLSHIIYNMALGRCSSRWNVTLCNKCIRFKTNRQKTNETEMKGRTQSRSFSKILTNNDGHGGRTTLE